MIQCWCKLDYVRGRCPRHGVMPDPSLVIKSGDKDVADVAASALASHVHPPDATTDYTEFEADGTMVMNGAATVWEDLRFPATAINPAGAPSPMSFDTTNIGFTASAAGTTVLAIIAQIPHAWKVGSSIYPHVHWEPTTTDTGNVLWRMTYRWTNIGGTEAGATSIDVLDAGDGTAFKHQLASFPAIAGTGKTLSSIISMTLSRIGGDDTDTYTGDALLKEFDIHYELDTLGSRTELAK